MKIWMLWMTAVVLATLFMLIAQVTQKKMSMEKEGWSQFECGFNIMNPSHLPFSFQFFMISLLFLIFDVEIALVLSYPLEPKTMKNSFMILTFLLILTIGLLYEWQKSKIEWSKWVWMNSLQELNS